MSEQIMSLIVEKLNEIQTSQATMEKRFDTLEGRFDTLENRFDTLEGRFDTLENRFDTLEGRFDTLENRFDTLEGRFDTLENRFDTLEGRFDKVEARLGKIETQMVNIPLVLRATLETSEVVTKIQIGQERQNKILETLALRSLEQETDIRELKRIK